MKEAQRSQHRKGWLLFDHKQEILIIFRNELENASGFMFVFKEEQEIKETSKKYVLQSWSKQVGLNPIVIDHAEGIYMYDAEGNRYTDMSSQLVNLTVFKLRVVFVYKKIFA